MHPKVKQLADRFGVVLSNRICFSVERGLPEDYKPEFAMYDGKSLATRIRFANRVFEKDDHGLMHDIAHYAVALPVQRELPEFGLGTPAYGQPLGITDRWGYEAIPSVIEPDESEIQEHMAQFLCVLWGKAYGISPRMMESPSYVSDWDEYFKKKSYAEHRRWLDELPSVLEFGWKRVWRSLIRLREDGWMQLPIP